MKWDPRERMRNINIKYMHNNMYWLFIMYLSYVRNNLNFQV